MRMSNIFNPFLSDICFTLQNNIYFVYVYHNTLYIKSLLKNRCIYNCPFDNCLNPRLIIHNNELVLAYFEKTNDNIYHLHISFPFNNRLHCNTDLNYQDKPCYSLTVLDNEIFLNVMCNRKLSVCHIKYNCINNTYIVKKLPFYK